MPEQMVCTTKLLALLFWLPTLLLAWTAQRGESAQWVVVGAGLVSLILTLFVGVGRVRREEVRVRVAAAARFLDAPTHRRHHRPAPG